MKLNEQKTDEMMELVASASELAVGKVVIKHPRNGRTVIEKVKGTRYWKVTACERPDE